MLFRTLQNALSESDIDGDGVRDLLVESGLWTAIRRRPFSNVPSPTESCRSVFVTAIDTNPHAANPAIAIDEDADAFADGLHIIRNLTDGTVHVCTAPDSGIPVPKDRAIRLSEFAGPHPAGLVGTHIHFLDPVGLAGMIQVYGPGQVA